VSIVSLEALVNSVAGDRIKDLQDQVEKRDQDWVLAIGHALGLDSGFEIPIVPEVEPFKELFEAIKAKGKDDE
jgi:hypothetical protein